MRARSRVTRGRREPDSVACDSRAVHDWQPRAKGIVRLSSCPNPVGHGFKEQLCFLYGPLASWSVDWASEWPTGHPAKWTD